MVSCSSIIDLKCIFVNEIFGSMLLAIIGLIIIYFLIMGRLRLGAELTMAAAIPIIIIVSLAIGGFSTVYAFMTLLVAFLVAMLFNKIIGNK